MGHSSRHSVTDGGGVLAVLRDSSRGLSPTHPNSGLVSGCQLGGCEALPWRTGVELGKLRKLGYGLKHLTSSKSQCLYL